MPQPPDEPADAGPDTAPPDDAAAARRVRAVVRARTRLAALVVVLAGSFVLLGVLGVLDLAAVRRTFAAAGPGGVAGWTALAAVLGALLVPGPLLGATSGVLYGPVVGSLVNVVASLGSSLIATAVGRAAGHEGARSFVPAARLERLEARRDRFGVTVVTYQRLAPGLPDAVSSYVFGALGFTLRQVALGTLLGSVPWAVAYALLGSSLDDPLSWRGALALAVFVAALVVGALAGLRGRRVLGPP